MTAVTLDAPGSCPWGDIKAARATLDCCTRAVGLPSPHRVFVPPQPALLVLCVSVPQRNASQLGRVWDARVFVFVPTPLCTSLPRAWDLRGAASPGAWLGAGCRQQAGGGTLGLWKGGELWPSGDQVCVQHSPAAHTAHSSCSPCKQPTHTLLAMSVHTLSAHAPLCTHALCPLCPFCPSWT